MCSMTDEPVKRGTAATRLPCHLDQDVCLGVGLTVCKPCILPYWYSCLYALYSTAATRFVTVALSKGMRARLRRGGGREREGKDRIKEAYELTEKKPLVIHYK